ncbi:MAG: hypothetical protein MK137_05020 [Rickettsiales bacterium]|nr:hypothetical protein [Rickettsiales bacterium]
MALPVSYGASNHHAITDQGDFLDMRFESGWLTVWIAKQGKESEIIIDHAIAPHDIENIMPEQLCYILGLTLDGHEVSHPSDVIDNYRDEQGYFDLSGTTTTWCMDIISEPTWDIGAFADKLIEAFPDSVIFQTETNPYTCHQRSRIIDFIMDQDKQATIGIGADDQKRQELAKQELITDSDFPFYLNIIQVPLDDVDGSASLNKQLDHEPEQGMEVNYKTFKGKRYNLSTVFRNDSTYAQSAIETLNNLTNEYFYSQFETYDLINHNKVHIIYSSYHPAVSSHIVDWIYEGHNRYAYVCYDDYSNPKYYGMKPVRNSGE